MTPRQPRKRADLASEEALQLRQEVLDELLRVCRRRQLDPASALITALYLASTAAHQGLAMDRDSFVLAALEIYDDLHAQVLEGQYAIADADGDDDASKAN